VIIDFKDLDYISSAGSAAFILKATKTLESGETADYALTRCRITSKEVSKSPGFDSLPPRSVTHLDDASNLLNHEPPPPYAAFLSVRRTCGRLTRSPQVGQFQRKPDSGASTQLAG